eukprot:Platyproteum_vivax@DN16253_c0_g1_i1.p1
MACLKLLFNCNGFLQVVSPVIIGKISGEIHHRKYSSSCVVEACCTHCERMNTPIVKQWKMTEAGRDTSASIVGTFQQDKVLKLLQEGKGIIRRKMLVVLVIVGLYSLIKLQVGTHTIQRQ